MHAAEVLSCRFFTIIIRCFVLFHTGTKLKPLVIRSGSDASAIINTFAISMASLYPVMVLSYEVQYLCKCVVFVRSFVSVVTVVTAIEIKLQPFAHLLF